MRSPGLMIEQRDTPEADAAGVVPARPNRRTKKGKLASFRVGSHVAYAISRLMPAAAIVSMRRTRSLQEEIDADRTELIAIKTDGKPEDQEEVKSKIQEMLPDDLETQLKEAHRKAEAKWDKLSLGKDWDQV